MQIPVPGWMIAMLLVSSYTLSFTYWRIVKETNEKLTTVERISPWFFTHRRMLRVWKSHRALYPSSRLRFWLAVGYGFAVSSFVVLVSWFCIRYPIK